jgi:hypothetical protein
MDFAFLKSEMFLYIAGALYVIVEFILGKTTLVKPGSVLELVLSGIVKILQALGVVKKDGAA